MYIALAAWAAGSDRTEAGLANERMLAIGAVEKDYNQRLAAAEARVQALQAENEQLKSLESRSTDDDVLPMAKGLQGSDAGCSNLRPLTTAEVLPLAIEPHVHARVGASELGGTSVKEAAGSEPADSHTLLAQVGDLTAQLSEAKAHLKEAHDLVARPDHDPRHDLPLCLVDGIVGLRCSLSDAQKENADLTQQLASLREAVSVCACGCPADQHESLGEDGESCSHDDHECVRTSPSVLSILTAITDENHGLRESLKAKEQADAALTALREPGSLLARLQFQPPPGPPDPPKPTTCPHGHTLTWLSPTVAICLGLDWDPAWRLLGGTACAPAKLVAVVDPTALVLAHAIRAACREDASLRGAQEPQVMSDPVPCLCPDCAIQMTRLQARKPLGAFWKCPKCRIERMWPDDPDDAPDGQEQP